MSIIIQRDRSIIPACDVSFEIFRNIVKGTAGVEKVGAYKVGPALTGRIGYDRVVEEAREHTNKPLIFDSQKWGTDIPDTAEPILTPLKESGIKAVIIFPESGPITEYEWIRTAQNLELGVIVGGEMTHPRYLEGDFSEGKKKNYTEIFRELGIERKLTGFIRKFAPDDMYELAARMGITDFVVPGNKPDKIRHYKELIENCYEDNIEAVFYSPGLVTQGGKISEGAEVAGRRFHGIVGRGIYWNVEEERYNTIKEIKEAALEHTSQL